MDYRTINALKASAWTALFAFLGPFLIAVLGWLNDVGRWASDHGRTPFPDISILGYAVVAAACSAAAFVMNLVIRFGQARNLLPGEPPAYARSSPDRTRDRRGRFAADRGAITVIEACALAIAGVVVLWAFGAVPVHR